jgi:SAM-dependent methyltransferase
LCAARGAAALPRYEHAHLRRCGSCGFVFAGRLPSAAELEAHYGGYGRDDTDSPITRRRYDELLDGFERHRSCNRILDMGCGVGYFLEQAALRGWEVHGSEVGIEALAINRAKGIEMRPAPLRAGDYEPGTFDVVTAFEVVEHVADPRAESRTLAHILRPGGLFYCTTPNFDSASRRLLGPAWSVIDYPEHLCYFTTATLCSWLEDAGFATAGVTTTGVSPRRLLSGLRRTSAKQAGQAGGVASDDERVRAAIEASRALGLAKRAANAVLTGARAGDTLKGRFVLSDRRG